MYLNSVSGTDIFALKNKFKNNNLDYDLFLEEVEIQTKWQNFIYLFYKEKIEINENSVNEELKKIIDSKKNYKEYNISEIEILTDKNNNFDQVISDLKDKIKEEGFDTAALRYSMSSSANKKGSLGWINANSLSKKFLKF